MAKYKGIVTTNAGLELLAKACSGGSVKFTAVKTGDGAYDGTEDLSGITALKNEKQSFGVSGIARTGNQVKVRSVLSNEGLTTGYNITEVGLFATDPDTGSEKLYAIIVAETGLEDYLPPYADSPSSITMEFYLTLTETENAVTFTADIVEGTYASAEDFQNHISSEGHITAEERSDWNAKAEKNHSHTAEDIGLGNVPNVSTNDQTPTYTVPDSLEDLSSGEKLSKAFGKIAKAVSDLISHISNKSNPHEVTKAQVGLGSVPNVSTNNQTPTYTPSDTDSELVSGEKLTTAFGKIAKAVSSLISHLGNEANPHKVTKSQVGLGNVDNTADKDKVVKKAGDADKLGGQPSSYFAPLADLANYVKSDGSNAWVSSVNDLNVFYTGITVVRYCENVPNDNWWLVISGGEGGTTVQTAYHLHGIETPKQRYCAGGSWSEWFDLNKDYLLLSDITTGGKRFDVVPKVGTDGVLPVGRIIDFHEASDGAQMARLYSNNKKLIYSDGATEGELLHTGNMAEYVLPKSSNRIGAINFNDTDLLNIEIDNSTHTIPIGVKAEELLTNQNYYLRALALNGGSDTINQVSDLNNFRSGIGLFGATIANNPFGDWCLVITGGTVGTITQIAFSLYNEHSAKVRYCGANVWYDWEDLNTGCLPKSGGTIESDLYYPLTIHNTVNGHCLFRYKANDEIQGSLGFAGINVPIFQSVSGNNHTLHHDGNSAKIWTEASTPPDTSYVHIY